MVTWNEQTLGSVMSLNAVLPDGKPGFRSASSCAEHARGLGAAYFTRRVNDSRCFAMKSASVRVNQTGFQSGVVPTSLAEQVCSRLAGCDGFTCEKDPDSGEVLGR